MRPQRAGPRPRGAGKLRPPRRRRRVRRAPQETPLYSLRKETRARLEPRGAPAGRVPGLPAGPDRLRRRGRKAFPRRAADTPAGQPPPCPVAWNGDFLRLKASPAGRSPLFGKEAPATAGRLSLRRRGGGSKAWRTRRAEGPRAGLENAVSKAAEDPRPRPAPCRAREKAGLPAAGRARCKRPPAFLGKAGGGG
jgi:hypothetical protein